MTKEKKLHPLCMKPDKSLPLNGWQMLQDSRTYIYEMIAAHNRTEYNQVPKYVSR